MKILVTGGTGFVGRVAAPYFAAAGHVVRLALRNDRPDLPYETCVVGNIGPSTDWGRAVDGADAVVHLAARVHVMRDDAGGADEFRRTNTEATLRLARSAAAAGVRRFVFVSTIKVNGESTTERAFQAEDPPSARDAYSQSKHAAELGLSRIDGLEPTIIRPPLIHGPGVKGNLARLCRLATLGAPVPFAGIENRRDLVGVTNLASLLERCVAHPAAAFQTFLVSDGESLSTPFLYQTIAAALGRPARMFNVPVSVIDTLGRASGLAAEFGRLTQSLEIDMTRTRETLQWAPLVPAATGIAEMAKAWSRNAS